MGNKKAFQEVYEPSASKSPFLPGLCTGGGADSALFRALFGGFSGTPPGDRMTDTHG